MRRAQDCKWVQKTCNFDVCIFLHRCPYTSCVYGDTHTSTHIGYRDATLDIRKYLAERILGSRNRRKAGQLVLQNLKKNTNITLTGFDVRSSISGASRH